MTPGCPDGVLERGRSSTAVPLAAVVAAVVVIVAVVSSPCRPWRAASFFPVPRLLINGEALIV
jgi:hypothetical protein